MDFPSFLRPGSTPQSWPALPGHQRRRAIFLPKSCWATLRGFAGNERRTGSRCRSRCPKSAKTFKKRSKHMHNLSFNGQEWQAEQIYGMFFTPAGSNGTGWWNLQRSEFVGGLSHRCTFSLYQFGGQCCGQKGRIGTGMMQGIHQFGLQVLAQT